MPYSKEHKAETRSRILKSAQNLFKKYGYKNVNIDQVMAHAGLTRGGFYAHFKSKKALVAASLNGHDGVRFMTKLMADNSGTYEERVEKLLTGYLSKSHRDHPDSGCPVAAMGTSVVQIGGDSAVAYAKLLEGMVLGLKRDLLKNMANDKIFVLISHAIGSLNLARTVAHNPAMSEQILTSSQIALREFILTNS